MKSIFKVVLVLCCLQSLAAQTIQERIRDLQSFDDVERFVQAQNSAVYDRLDKLNQQESLPVGVERLQDGVIVNGQDTPELIILFYLLQNTFNIGEVIIPDLLKRGFPEGELPVFREILQKKLIAVHDQHAQQALKRIYADLSPSTTMKADLNWRTFAQTVEGKHFFNQRQEVINFFEMRRQARIKARDTALLELLAPLKIHAIRVLLSFCYELIAPNSEGGFDLETYSDQDIDRFIEQNGSSR